jgi:protein phosphatase
LKRDQNQDSICFSYDHGLFVVADGMGGHQGGEIASQLACQSILTSFEENPDQNPPEKMVEAIQNACASIYRKGQDNPELQGMGTTVSAVVFEKETATIGHVGDSRVYLFDGPHAWQLSDDHSLIAERIRRGELTRKEAKNDKFRNVILRSVGFEASVEVDIYSHEIKSSQVYLLCSDGLTGNLEDERLAKILDLDSYNGLRDADKQNEYLHRKAKALVNAANEEGGDDNISVILVHAIPE